MTGEWEYKLKQMERGELPRSRFMQEIIGLTQTIVEKAKGFEETGYEAKPLGFNGRTASRWSRRCAITRPRMDRSRCARWWRVGCSSRSKPKSCSRKKLIGPLQGFRSKAGWPFAAALN